MVKVLQGLNLENEISSIEIHVKKTVDLEKIIKLIHSFHPIFIKEYKFTEDTLKIYTNIPSLWEELGSVLERNLPYKETLDKCLEIIRIRVSSMSTIPLLFAAHKLGYETTPTMATEQSLTYTPSFNRHYTVGCGKGSEIIYSISSSQDSKIAKEIQRDKWSSNLVIQKLGLPLPSWEIIDSFTEIENVWKHFEKPVVIKPTGLTGGSGVSVGINTIEEAKEAYKYAKEMIDSKLRKDWQTKVMMQEQVSGEDYRLLVIDGHLEVVTKRIPAFVIGNGKDTIAKLIEDTNKDPKRDITSPAHTLKPIEIDQPLKAYLKAQGLDLSSIPQKEQKIAVRKVASMSQGGITEDFTDKVGPEIKSIVESIATSIHAFALGVDIMCKDISKPLTTDNGAILEINTMPEAYLNLFPVIGIDRGYVADTYIKKLLVNNKTKKIVVIGHPQYDIPTTLKQKNMFSSYLKKEDVVGEYKDGEIRINSLALNKDLTKKQGVEALKLNASLDAIIIHHRNWEEVTKDGLGLNKIDLLMIETSLKENKDCMKVINKYKRKGLISKIKTF